MTSELKAAANLLNAAKSTGPRTETGKAASALNALKHGFSGQLNFDPETEEQINTLAQAFAGTQADDPRIIAAARNAAEAQVMVQRIKITRQQVWHEARHSDHIVRRGEMIRMLDPDYAKDFLERFGSPVTEFVKVMPHLFEEPFEDDAAREAAIADLAIRKLSTFVRYERHAVNRRDKALRELERLKADLENAPE